MDRRRISRQTDKFFHRPVAPSDGLVKPPRCRQGILFSVTLPRSSPANSSESHKAPGDIPELYWVWRLSLPLPGLELVVLFRGQAYRDCHHADRVDCDGVTLFGSRWIDRPDRGCENSYTIPTRIRMGDLLQLFGVLFALANPETSRISRARCVGQHKKTHCWLESQALYRHASKLPAASKYHVAFCRRSD